MTSPPVAGWPGVQGAPASSTLWLYSTSQKTPVDLGLPPVISAVPPGSESDGLEVSALVYSLPERVNLASVELGWLAMYQLRSLWCIPSTEISRTCLSWCALAGLAG